MDKREIVIIMGYNAAGKSTIVERFVKKGLIRYNRDVLGCSIDELAEKVEQYYNGGGKEGVVLDNTYPTVKSRKSIINVAKKHKIPILCVWLTTSLEDAQLNACLRMMRLMGKVLNPEDFKGTKNPNLFPPAALFHYRKEFEKPTVAEGFNSVDEIPFRRQWPNKYINRALILDYDGTLRESVGKEEYPIAYSDIRILPGRTKKLKEYQDAGYALLGASNQSGVAKGKLTYQTAQDLFEETNRLLGVAIDYQFCPHRIPPITCYCRKPSPGIGAYFIEKYMLNPADCIMVGDQTTDQTFAERCGFKYIDQKEFFK